MTELFKRLSEIFAIVNAEYRALDKADKQALKRDLPNNNIGDESRILTNRPKGAENRIDRINLARKFMKGDKNARD
jgi:hypothetical protein